jgi:general L-amino acid transport system substrate-binding protein
MLYRFVKIPSTIRATVGTVAALTLGVVTVSFLAPLGSVAQAQAPAPAQASAPAPAPVSGPVSVSLSPVLDRLRAAHGLQCGVVKEEEDYSHAEDHGNRAVFDLDMCKAVAVATLGPGAHVVVKAYPDEADAIKALAAGEVDLLASASPSVDNMAKGLVFSRPTFYDGESLMIRNNPAIHSAGDLAGKKVCFVIESRAEAGMHTWALRQHIRFIWYPFSELGELEASFFTNNCDALAGDVTQLANTRAINRAHSTEYTILPQILRNDPLSVATQADDPRFAAIVDWTVNTLIEAENLGMTQANAAAQSVQAARPVIDADPRIVQLLGQRYGTGSRLGLDDHWALHVIEAVGNYGEIFDRDLGKNSPLHLDRGENRLWTDGGLMYPLPQANP